MTFPELCRAPHRAPSVTSPPALLGLALALVQKAGTEGHRGALGTMQVVAHPALAQECLTLMPFSLPHLGQHCLPCPAG